MRAMAIYYALGAGAVVAAGAGVVVARNPELLPPSLRLQRVEPPAKIAALPSPAAAPSASVAPMPTVAASPVAANEKAEPLPGFDIVRVERDGSAVIAGHAAPGEKVELRDGDKVLGSVVADDAGQFVFVPDSLSTGAHSLRLAALSSKGEPRLSTPSTIEVVGASAPAPTPKIARRFDNPCQTRGRGRHRETRRAREAVARDCVRGGSRHSGRRGENRGCDESRVASDPSRGRPGARSGDRDSAAQN